MALRSAIRRFAAKSVALESAKPLSLYGACKQVVKDARSFKFSQFFDEKYFWEKANLGPFFIMLFLTPTIYRSMKDVYWTGQLKKLNTEEIIRDRYEWLRMSMFQDEVDAALLKKMPAGGVAPLELGPSMPPQ